MDPELQAELERLMGNAGAGADALARLNSSIRSGLPNWNAANNSLNMFGQNASDASKKTKTFGDVAKSAFDRIQRSTKQASDGVGSAFKSVANESENGANVLSGFVEGVGKATAGLAGVVPYLGPAIGGIITAATGAASAILGFIGGLTDVNKAIGSLGIYMDDLGKGTGIDALDSAAQNAGLTMGILSKAISNNVENLRLMGGTSNSIKLVTDSFAKLRHTMVNGQKQTTKTFEQLTYLGYSSQDMVEAMIDVGAAAKMAGKDLNTDQLADSTKKYLTQQAELRRITGADVKAAKEKQKAMQADFAFSAFLNEIADQGDVSAIQNFIGSLENAPEAVQSLTKTILGGGQVTDANLKYLEGAMGPNFTNSLLDMRSKALDQEQKLSSEYMTTTMKTISDSIVTGLTKIQKDFGSEFLTTASQTNSKFSEIIRDMGPTLLYFKELQNQLSKGKSIDELLKGQTGQISKSLTSIESASISLQAMAYTMMAGLAGVMGPLTTTMADTTEKYASKIQDGVKALSTGIQQAENIMAREDLSDAQKSQMIKEALMQGATNAFGESSMFTGLFEKLGDTISASIADGFSEAWKELSPASMSRREAAEFEKTPEFKAILNKIDNMESGQEITSALSLDDMVALETFMKAFRPEEATQKYNQFGLESKQLESWLGFDYENYVKKSQMGTQRFAVGGIIDPKPGGHIVKVAEAGQPEVIAPASRGPNGKLGLEVSGAMLDNSRLLQSLLKVNEGQAAMMAGLNSQMSSMNSNFEKLVSEQRQANRLAV